MLLDVKITPWLFWKGFIAQGAGKLLMSDHHGDEDNDHSSKVGDNFEDPQKILVSNWGVKPRYPKFFVYSIILLQQT